MIVEDVVDVLALSKHDSRQRESNHHRILKPNNSQFDDPMPIG